MKIKTSELKGVQLDLAVAMCESPDDWAFRYTSSGEITTIICGATKENPRSRWGFHPTKDWAHGGPIIERMHGENAGLLVDKLGTGSFSFKAVMKVDQDDETKFCYGATVLEVAMRCYVASKLGDEVEIPEELL